MAVLPVGTWIQRHVSTLCLNCYRSVDFAPGTLSQDGVWEVRTCPECRAPWKTEALYVAAPSEATESNAF